MHRSEAGSIGEMRALHGRSHRSAADGDQRLRCGCARAARRHRPRLVAGHTPLRGGGNSARDRFDLRRGCIQGRLPAVLLLVLLGEPRLDALIRWWSQQPALAIRAWCVLSGLVGALVLYAALPGLVRTDPPDAGVTPEDGLRERMLA